MQKLLYHCESISCDEEFLVCRNDPDLDLGIGCGDLDEFASCGLVLFGIDLNAEEFHILSNTLTDFPSVFADAACE